ncbi:hypothetical protein ACH30J_04585 [Enterobacter hormaechei subsp. xiangfangensis]
MKKLTLVVIMEGLLAGCAYNPSPVEISQCNAGFPPEGTAYQGDIVNTIKVNLKDPDSARFNFDAPRKVWINADMSHADVRCGYFVGTTVNAKNSFGGYTGWEPIAAIWNNGTVITLAPAVFDNMKHGFY